MILSEVGTLARVGTAAALAASVSVVGCAGSRAANTDPAPPAALAVPHLYVVPAHAELRCRQSGVELCPSVLPKPILGPLLRGGRNGRVPALQVESRTYLDRGGRFAWVSFSYGAPWEPGSGGDWRQHLWRNRPCCFLHFEIYRRLSGASVTPENAKPATLGGKRGFLAQPAGSGTFCGNGNRGVYWCNHLRFIWKQSGHRYAAGLHWFGPGTRALLAQLVSNLR